jgi:hypothetical protein
MLDVTCITQDCFSSLVLRPIVCFETTFSAAKVAMIYASNKSININTHVVAITKGESTVAVSVGRLQNFFLPVKPKRSQRRN